LLDAGGAGSIGAPPHRAAAIEAAKSVAGGSLATRNRPVIVAVRAVAGKAPTQDVHGRCLGWRDTTARQRMTDRIPVLLNAASGPGPEPDDAAVRAAFAAVGCDIDIARLDDCDRLDAQVARALRARPSLLVAGGGDGTVAAVASQLVDGDTVLGVLPLGTLNHFARDLGIPLPLQDAARVLADGRRTQVDVGELRGGGAHEPAHGNVARVFLNNSSLGLYPRIVSARDAAQHRLHIGKWPALVRATWHALRDSRSFDVRLDVEGETLQRRTPFVFIGNNRYALQGFAAGRRPRLDEGVLSVYVLRPQSLFGFLRLALRALLGRVSPDDDFEAFTAGELRVESSRARVEVALDGEVASFDTPLHYRLRPRALQVLVPAAGDGGR
jgi:diacylglycerol kinase family enzyme